MMSDTEQLPEEVLAEMERLHAKESWDWEDTDKVQEWFCDDTIPTLVACARRDARTQAALKDPAAVWANMLRGEIAKPGQIEYLEKRVSELEILVAEQANEDAKDRIEREKRIAELEAARAESERAERFVFEERIKEKEHVAKLEALLDRVEHMPHHTITDGGGFMVVICKPYCPRCAWERMK
jgi:hypothetical protein